MKLRTWLSLGLLAFLGLGVGLVARDLLRGPAPNPLHADPALRAARAAGADISVEDWPLVVEREQRALERLDLEDDHALREWVGARFEAIEPTEEELRAVWEEQRAVFGQRTFEASRDVLVRIVRLRRVRAELEAAAR